MRATRIPPLSSAPPTFPSSSSPSQPALRYRCVLKGGTTTGAYFGVLSNPFVHAHWRRRGEKEHKATSAAPFLLLLLAYR